MSSATLSHSPCFLLALETLVVIALLSILIWQVWRLVKLVQTEAKPIIRDTQETVSTVRGTTGFVSENLINPIIAGNSKMAGAVKTAMVLTAGLRTPINKK